MQCSIQGCEGEILARGFCCKHYNRFKKHGDPLATKLPRTSFDRPEELKASLLSRRRIDKNGCWLWTMTKTRGGYGQIMVGAERFTVHRVSAKLWLDFDIESDLLVLHKCDVRQCFNPDHLFTGDHKDNSEDMVHKGRSAVGQNNAQSKLRDEDVVEIRTRLSDGETQQSIADAFNVTQPLIGFIKRGVRWKHIK